MRSDRIPGHQTDKVSERIRDLQQVVLDGKDVAVFVKDVEGRYLYSNTAAGRYAGWAVDDIINQNANSGLGEEAAIRCHAHDQRVMASGLAETVDYVTTGKAGKEYFSVTKSPYFTSTGTVIGIIGVVRDITSERSAEAVLGQQNALLERIALGAPLPELLNQIAALIEQEVPESICAFQLVEAGGQHLRVATTGGLEESFTEVIDGAGINVEAGPDAAAAYRGEDVAIEDIESLQSWDEFRNVALAHGYRSCFAHPIKSRLEHETVLGTLAVYFRQPTKLCDSIRRSIDRIEPLACIAIESAHSHQELKASEARFRHFVNNTTDSFFMLDDTVTIVDCSERACEHLGYSREELVGKKPNHFDLVTGSMENLLLLVELGDGGQLSFESVHTRKDGTLVPVDVRLVNLHLDGRRFAIATVRDISQQKQTKRQLIKSNRQLSSIYKTAADIIFLLSVEPGNIYRFESINPAFTKATGLSPESVLGNRVEQVIPESSLAVVLDGYQRAITTRQLVRWEETSVYPTGRIMLEVSISPVFDDVGNCTHLVGCGHDLFDRKQAEAALQASEERHRSLIASVAEGIVFQSAAGEILTSNQSAERILGLTSAQICGRTSLDPRWRAIQEDGSPFLGENHPSMVTLRTGEAMSNVVMGVHKPDGTLSWININSEPLCRSGEETPYAVVTSFSDFTARKVAEDQLRESERRLAEAQKIACIGSWSWNPSSDEVWWSDSVYDLFGLNRVCVQPGTEVFYSLVHPDDRLIATQWSEAILAGEQKLSRDLRIVRSDGKVIWIHSRAQVTRDASGAIVLVEGTDQDITARKQTEQKLKESQQYSQAVIQATPECIKILDRNGALIQMNAAGLAMIDAESSEDVVGGCAYDLVVPEDRERFINFHERVCDGASCMLKFDIIGLKGKRRSVESHAVPIYIHGTRMHLAVSRDVTTRNLAEKTLRHSEERQRVALQAAGAVAFDWDVEADRVTRYDRAASEHSANSGQPERLADVKNRVHADDQSAFEASIARCLKNGAEYRSLHRVNRPGSSVAWFEEWGILERHPDGRPRRLTGISVDVTERKRAERELIRTSSLLNAVVNGTTDAIFVKDIDGKYLLLNEAAAGFVEKSISEVLGKDDTELFDPQSAEFLQERDRQVIVTGQVDTVEETLTVNGVTRTFLGTKGPYFDESGRIAGVLGIAHDITSRKIAERKLKLTRFGIDNSSDSMFWITSDGKLIDVNDGACRNLGYTRAELVGKTVSDINPHYSTDRWKYLWEILQSSGHYFIESQHTTKDGRLLDMEIRGTLLKYEDQELVCAFARNVTDRKRSQKRVATQHAAVSILAGAADLHEAAPQLLQAICETAGWDVGELWMHDQNADLLENRERWHQADFDIGDFHEHSQKIRLQRGEGLPGRIWETARSEWVADFDQPSISSRGPLAKQAGLRCQYGFPILLGDAVIGAAAFFGRQAHAPDDDLLKMLESLGIQIGKFIEQKQAEARLRLFRTLIEHATDFIEVIDPQTGRMLDVNQRACEAHGYTRDEYLELTVRDVDTQVSASESYGEMVNDLGRKSSLSFESRHKRKDGSEFPVEVNVNMIHLDREYLVAVVRDITERTQMEQHFRQSQKMDAVGRLAGGVAHDFNNLLTVINGYTELLLAVTDEHDQRKEQMQAIQEAGNRAAELTAQLLAFSRKTFVEPRIVDLNEVVTSSNRLLSRLIREDVLLEFAPDPSLALIKVDPRQIEQAIMNLVVNARDAMPQGGELCISTCNLVIGKGDTTEFPDMLKGLYVCLQVADTGSGMSQEIQDKIFEPFFTTKEVGKGTGLGLSVVHGVMTQCGGHVRVTSEVGSGTVFHLLFPATVETGEPNLLQRESLTPGSTETVLVVEDEPAVRSITRTMLESQGFRTLVAGSGLAAQKIIDEYQGPIHLLLTDVVMPKMGGRELARLLRTRRPEMRIVFMSGHTDETIVELGLVEAGDAFLQKPFTTVGLVRKIRRVLDKE